MAETGRKSRFAALGPFSGAMIGSGLAAFGTFAPDRSIQSVDVEVPMPRSPLDALAGDFGRLAGDMREAAESLGGQSEDDE